MVKMRKIAVVAHQVFVIGSAVVGMLATSACAGDEIVVPTDEQPFLYLVLNERRYDSNVGAVGQHAMLLTTGSPTQRPRYQTAERFEMRRARDGALFAWRDTGMRGEVSSFPSVALDQPNYSLADQPVSLGLGAEDLAAGEMYELAITIEGKVLRGRVTIPSAPVLSVIDKEGGKVAVWSPISGSAGYRISMSNSGVLIQQDTTFSIPPHVVSSGWIRVEALSPEVFQYATDPQLVRAGLSDGYGVFGAVSGAILQFP